jgi:hypothetical protein
MWRVACQAITGPRHKEWVSMATSRFDYPIEPMTLGNMRENGVRSLAVVCTKCGTIGADVRPNWRERGT